jgi:hypothetical protein
LKWISKLFGGGSSAAPEAAAEAPAAGEAPPTWRCVACNAVNEDSGKYCGNCSRPRPWDPVPAYVYQNSATGLRPAPPPAQAVPWTCPQCGHENRREYNFCIMCQAKRPPSRG